MPDTVTGNEGRVVNEHAGRFGEIEFFEIEMGEMLRKVIGNREQTGKNILSC